MEYKEQHFLCPNDADCMETIQGNCLYSDRPLGKKEQGTVSREHLTGCRLEEQQICPSLGWCLVFVEIIHQIPDGARRAVLRSGQEGAWVQKLSAQRVIYTVTAGATSLLHAAALALVSPGAQVLECCLWRKAERVFHCSLAGVSLLSCWYFTALFSITPISVFSPGRPVWVFGLSVCQWQFQDQHQING